MKALKPIVVVGSINMDLVARVGRLPHPGETVAGLEFRTHPGGKGANQAAAIGRLGYPAQLVGRVGNDSFGRELKKQLRSCNVDISAVQSAEGASGVAIILVSEGGENSIVVTPGANSALTPSALELHREVIRGAGMVLMQLEIPLDTVVFAARMCEEYGIPLMLDPAPSQTLPPSLIQRTAWFTPNETEAEFYAHSKDPRSIVESLRALKANGILLKMGARGVYVSDSQSGEAAIEAFPVTAVDSTAAGDAFNGAFAVSQLLGHNIVRSARFASAAAAISVTRFGAQPSMPARKETEIFLRQRLLAAKAQTRLRGVPSGTPRKKPSPT